MDIVQETDFTIVSKILAFKNPNLPASDFGRYHITLGGFPIEEM